MIPPEPDPPTPPEPTVPEYTYATATEFTIGTDNIPAVYYSGVQLGDTQCKLPYQYGPSSHLMTKDLVDLVLYEVGGTQYVYFAQGNASYFYGILANNSAMHTTVNVYSVDAGSSSVAHEGYVMDSTPSDYYTNVKSGNFTLSQRS